jgi:type IV secretory pathway TrbL component
MPRSPWMRCYQARTQRQLGAIGGSVSFEGAFAGGARGTIAGGAASAFRTGGLSGVAQAGASTVASPLRRVAARLGGATNASGDLGNADPGSVASESPPAWARRMKRTQTITHSASAATHAVRAGDHAGGGAAVDLSEGNR